MPHNIVRLCTCGKSKNRMNGCMADELQHPDGYGGQVEDDGDKDEAYYVLDLHGVALAHLCSVLPCVSLSSCVTYSYFSCLNEPNRACRDRFVGAEFVRGQLELAKSTCIGDEGSKRPRQALANWH